MIYDHDKWKLVDANQKEKQADFKHFQEKALIKWRPHEESNLDLRFRKPLFYPLNYGDS